MEAIFLLLAAVLAFFLLFKVVRKTVSMFFTITTVVGIALLILGFFVIQDAMEFRENFGSSESVVVVADEENIVAAIAFNFEEEEGVTPYDNFELLGNALEDEAAPPGYYKLFVITREALESADVSSIDLGVDIDKDVLVEAVFEEDSISYLAEEIAGLEDRSPGIVERELIASFGNDQNFKSVMAANLMVYVFGSNPLNLIEGVGEGNIIIYPETLMFRTMKYIPFSVFEQAGGEPSGDNG